MTRQKLCDSHRGGRNTHDFDLRVVECIVREGGGEASRLFCHSLSGVCENVASHYRGQRRWMSCGHSSATNPRSSSSEMFVRPWNYRAFHLQLRLWLRELFYFKKIFQIICLSEAQSTWRTVQPFCGSKVYIVTPPPPSNNITLTIHVKKGEVETWNAPLSSYT